jgi:putative mRNA 3-end processing factor
VDVVTVTDRGLYVPAGDFFIDPWQPVDQAIVTHGHADHARPVAKRILAARGSEGILSHRLPDIPVSTLGYGETLTIGDARISLHPAGHVLGSAQVRIEVRGEVWVVSGDYKLARDPTCAPFEPIRCNTFVTEATFGLPIFRWAETRDVLEEIARWRRACRDAERTPVLFAYALGKSQRLLSLLDEGPFVVHGAVEGMVRAYRSAGIALPETIVATDVKTIPEGSIVIAPPRAQGTPWLQRFQPFSLAFVSGWMRVRGVRRRRSLDRGFALSDHADWTGLVTAIGETGAASVRVTHGSQRAMVRYLREEKKLDAAAMETAFAGEAGAEDDESTRDTAIGVNA